MTRIECPVYQLLNEALDQTHTFAGAMRRLRAKMTECAYCESYEDCPVMRNFRTAIHTVIEDITQQWDLRV